MLKAFGKWAAKKAVSELVKQFIRVAGGGPTAQEIGKFAANETMDQVFGD